MHPGFGVMCLCLSPVPGSLRIQIPKLPRASGDIHVAAFREHFIIHRMFDTVIDQKIVILTDK